jgi:hypothetical protein
MNIDKDFTFQTIKLAPYEGGVATLISSNRNLEERSIIILMVIMTISFACS